MSEACSCACMRACACWALWLLIIILSSSSLSSFHYASARFRCYQVSSPTLPLPPSLVVQQLHNVVCGGLQNTQRKMMTRFLVPPPRKKAGTVKTFEKFSIQWLYTINIIRYSSDLCILYIMKLYIYYNILYYIYNVYRGQASGVRLSSSCRIAQ